MRLQGWSDRPLNDTGRHQATAAIPALQKTPIDLIVSSPLVRARTTAEIINDALNKPIHFDADLRERNFGDLEGMNLDQIRAFRASALLATPEAVEENGYPPPSGGEKYVDFKQRTFSRIQHYLQAHPGKNVLFVAHGGIYRALRLMMVNDQEVSGNAEPWLFDKTASGWAIRKVSI